MKANYTFLIASLFFLFKNNFVQAQNGGTIEAWKVSYSILNDVENDTYRALEEFTKAMFGDETILTAYLTRENIRVEAKSFLSYVQISNLQDSLSYQLDAFSKTAYQVPLAMPKINVSFEDDDSLSVFTSDDLELRFIY